MVVRRVLYGGKELILEGTDRTTLLEGLRAHATISSVLAGCSNGTCGTCRVLLAGRLVNACEVSIESLADGSEIDTLETVRTVPDVRRALDRFQRSCARRCGMCNGNVAVTAAFLARASEAPTDEAVAEAVGGSQCWCSDPSDIGRAIKKPT